MLNKDLFDENIKYVIGKGNHVRFFVYQWCQDEPLMKKFPRFYVVSRRKMQMVENIF